MNKLANIILAIALGVANLALAFWALGVVLGQWNLLGEFGQYLTFANFVALTMVIGVFEARGFGNRFNMQDRLDKLDGKESSVESTVKNSIASAVAIIMMLGFSWIWSAILL